MKHVSSINDKKQTSPTIETKNILQLSNHISTKLLGNFHRLLITITSRRNNNGFNKNAKKIHESEAFMPFCISTGL